MRNRDRRGSAASDWAEAQSGLPDWGVRGAWDLGAHNPTPDDSGGVDQDQYTKKGDTWIRKNYPGINFVTKAKIRS